MKRLSRAIKERPLRALIVFFMTAAAADLIHNTAVWVYWPQRMLNPGDFRTSILIDVVSLGLGMAALCVFTDL